MALVAQGSRAGGSAGRGESAVENRSDFVKCMKEVTTSGPASLQLFDDLDCLLLRQTRGLARREHDQAQAPLLDGLVRQPAHVGGTLAN
jgi:hypothetical protein